MTEEEVREEVEALLKEELPGLKLDPSQVVVKRDLDGHVTGVWLKCEFLGEVKSGKDRV